MRQETVERHKFPLIRILGSLDDARKVVSALNRYLAAALEVLDPGEDAFVLSSDHGNIEDMENSSHTLNPVPIMLWGKGLEEWRSAREVPSICDVAPGILSLVEIR